MISIGNVKAKIGKQKSFVTGGRETLFFYIGNQTKSLFMYSYLPYSKVMKEREYYSSNVIREKNFNKEIIYKTLNKYGKLILINKEKFFNIIQKFKKNADNKKHSVSHWI